MLRLALAFMLFTGTTAHADTVIHGTETGPKKALVPKEYHTGLLKAPPSFRDAVVKKLDLSGDPACDNLPANFDLLTDVVPTPISAVRDQGQCGSCWDFSKTGAFESYLRVSGKGDFNLSEEEILSNDGNNYGCNGGLLNPGREYQMVKGQGLETAWPYTASEQRSKTIPAVAKAPDFQVVAGSGAVKVKNIQCALFKYHTTPWITVSAGGSQWGSPPTTEGALWPRCTNRGTNHAIGVSGYKTVNNVVYFHAKNSWGTGWGQKGYAWIPLGCDDFGDEVAFLPASPAPGPGPGPGPDPVPFKCQAQLDAVGTALDSLKACTKTK